MKLLIPFFSLSLLLSNLAFAEKKTPEKYWSETGLSTNALLNDLKILSSASCHSEIKAYLGCVAAINAMAALADPPLQLVPSSLARDSSMAFGAAIKSYPGLSLVQVKVEKSTDESLRLVWEKSEVRRKKTREALAKLFESRKAHSNFELIFKDVASHALKDASKDSLAAGGAVSAFLTESMDAHARVEPLAQLQDSMNDADQSFTGIGATLQSLNGKTIVMNVIDGSPALRSGVRPNDIILNIDGVSADGKKIDQVVKLIRGPESSLVSLRVQRKGEEILIPITRGHIKLENVESKVVEDLGSRIGVIKLRSFMDNKACSLISAKLSELQQKNITGLVIDLRGNGGGLLDQSVCIGGLLLGAKLIVKVKDLQSDTFQDLSASGSAQTSLPIVTLIDAGSASASEILSGALQDHKRAWVIGERSFGKGTVQAPTGFYNQNIVMYRTVQRFYQPLGRTNQMVGISPDIEIPAKPDATADDRFMLREGDIYPNGLEAVGPVWSQARPEGVKKIANCLEAGNLAKAKYEEAVARELVADYQLLAAQEVLRCDR